MGSRAQEAPDNMMPEKKKERIAQLRAELKELQAVPRSDWHAGFEALLRIDMHRYGSRVRIETEKILGEEPPRADYLVVKGEAGLEMEDEIFRVFRMHNIIEYKNPHDNLNERTLRKACGYANFYIAAAEHEGDVPPGEVTISIFRAAKNAQLFREMEARGRLERGTAPGIYRVLGLSDLPWQIVVTGELEGPEYAAYRALTDCAREQDVGQVISRSAGEADYSMRQHYRVLLDLIAKKNPDVVERIRRDRDMAVTWMDIFKDDIDKKISMAEAVKEQETKAFAIRRIMENLKLPAEQAMEVLEIPEKQRSMYAGLINK